MDADATRALDLQRGADRFHFRVLLKYFVAHFAAPAGLFVSAERHRGVEDVVAVNPDRAGAQPGREAVGLLDVPRPNSGSQPIF